MTAEHIIIAEGEARKVFTADGVQTVFDYDFPIFQESDLKVYLGGSAVPEGSGYDVTGAGISAGGTVVFDSAPAAGSSVVLVRDVPIERVSDFSDSGAFRASVINTELDRLMAIAQQLATRIRRSVRQDDSDPAGLPPGGLNLPAAQPGKALGWNAAGDGLSNLAIQGPAGPQGPAGADGADGVFSEIATRVEAEAGADNARGMTPLRTRQALDAYMTRIAHNYGTAAAGGTITLDPANGLFGVYTNNGDHTLSRLASTGSWRQTVIVINGATPGVVSLAAFDQVIGSFDQVAGRQFLCDVSRINGVDTLIVTPLLATAAGGILNIRDEKPDGTPGGTFTSGAWLTRDLNTVVENTIAGACLSSNEFSLPAGTYEVFGAAPARAVADHQARIYNLTDAAVVMYGSQSDCSTPVRNDSLIFGRFTLSGTKVLRLEHRCRNGSATNGYGSSTASLGVNPVYSHLYIRKIA